jgi:LETM1 and EF-hand domain-containing protein 1
LTTSTTKTKEPSSKIEETVERLKEKKKAEPEVAKETEKVVKTSTATSAPVAKDETTTTVETPRKKTLWVRFKDEVKHYYSGFKLLYLDVNVSSKILLKLVRGKPLTRRESRQLVRTTSVIIYNIYPAF